MKRTNILWVLSIALLIALITSGIVYAVSPDQQARIFADECFSTGIAESALVDCGYTSEEEATRAHLGEPIKNYMISYDKLDMGKSLKENSQEMPFYVLPIIVDGEVVTDFIILLENGKWEFVSVGGNMSKLAYEMAKDNKINISQVNMLRFGGQSYLFADKNGNEVAYSPYISSPELGMNKQKTYSSEKIKKQLEIRQKQIQEKMKTRDTGIMGGENYGAYGPIDFHQSKSVLSRLLGYLDYSIVNQRPAN